MCAPIQRQGDLLKLTSSAYDGTRITLKQSKTGSTVRVKIAQEIKRLLDAQERTAVTILANRKGQPFTEGFRCSWAEASKVAGVEGMTFHYLRGTFITLAHRAGASNKEITEVSGHSEKDAEAIIRKHYFAGDAAVTRLETMNKKRAKL